MSYSLQAHGLQHARLPCPSLSPGVCSNSCPLSQWCHPTISSSVTPFSSCPQSFPASRSLLFLLLDGYWEIGTGGSLVTLVFYVCDIEHNNLPHKAIWGTEQNHKMAQEIGAWLFSSLVSPYFHLASTSFPYFIFFHLFFCMQVFCFSFYCVSKKKELITIILPHDIVYQTLFLVISSYSVLLVSFTFIWFIIFF